MKNKFGAIVCCLCMALVFVSGSLRAQTYESTFEYALDLIKHEDYAKAILQLDDAIALEDDHAEAYYNRGFCKLQIRSYKYALEDFNKALEIRPDLVSALYWRGRTYAVLGRHKEAIADLGTASHMQNDTDAEIKTALAETYMAAKDFTHALKEYTALQKLDPKDLKVVKGKGISEYNLNKLAEAVPDLEKYLSVYTKDADALQAYMDAAYRTGNMQKAYSAAQRFVALKKHAELGYALMANINYMQNNFSQAVENCTGAIQANPGYAIAYYTRGGCYAALKQNDKACADFTKAAELGYPGAKDLAKQFCGQE